MRVRSTGLGKTEMICHVERLKILDGHLIMILESTEPVHWRIRTALTYKDIMRILKIGIFVIFTYLVTNLKTIFSTPTPPADF